MNGGLVGTHITLEGYGERKGTNPRVKLETVNENYVLVNHVLSPIQEGNYQIFHLSDGMPVHRNKIPAEFAGIRLMWDAFQIPTIQLRTLRKMQKAGSTVPDPRAMSVSANAAAAVSGNQEGEKVMAEGNTAVVEAPAEPQSPPAPPASAEASAAPTAAAKAPTPPTSLPSGEPLARMVKVKGKEVWLISGADGKEREASPSEIEESKAFLADWKAKNKPERPVRKKAPFYGIESSWKRPEDTPAPHPTLDDKATQILIRHPWETTETIKRYLTSVEPDEKFTQEQINTLEEDLAEASGFPNWGYNLFKVRLETAPLVLDILHKGIEAGGWLDQAIRDNNGNMLGLRRRILQNNVNIVLTKFPQLAPEKPEPKVKEPKEPKAPKPPKPAAATSASANGGAETSDKELTPEQKRMREAQAKARAAATAGKAAPPPVEA